jgi:hypothetical protein
MKEERYAVIKKSVSNNCCFEATVVDTCSASYTGIDSEPIYHFGICECFSEETANEICDAMNANEKYKKEIERLKYEVKHWKEARDVALAGVEILKDELKTLKDELEIARDEVERLRAKMDLY